MPTAPKTVPWLHASTSPAPKGRAIPAQAIGLGGEWVSRSSFTPALSPNGGEGGPAERDRVRAASTSRARRALECGSLAPALDYASSGRRNGAKQSFADEKAASSRRTPKAAARPKLGRLACPERGRGAACRKGTWRCALVGRFSNRPYQPFSPVPGTRNPTPALSLAFPDTRHLAPALAFQAPLYYTRPLIPFIARRLHCSLVAQPLLEVRGFSQGIIADLNFRFRLLQSAK